MLPVSLEYKLIKNRDLIDLTLLHGPSFVQWDIERLDEIPVFTFHRESASELEQLFAYLAENSYSSLTADEFHERSSAGDVGRREVLLTFDDGHKTLRDVAFPLLRRYRLKAVAFVLPGLIPDGTRPGRHGVGDELCSWDELAEMRASGLIDVQSHSLFHHSIFVSSRIVGFVSPGWRPSFLNDWTFPVHEVDGRPVLPEDLAIGSPIYESAPRFASRHRCREDGGAGRRCAEHVQENGAASFFERPRWRQELAGVARRSSAGRTYFESDADRETSMRRDLRSAKTILETRLPGNPVRHFAFPWFWGSRTAARISGEEGFLTNFWGWSVIASDLPGAPLAVRRLDPRYVMRLPGKGRLSLGRLLNTRVRALLPWNRSES